MSNGWERFSDRKPKDGEEVLVCFIRKVVVGFYDSSNGRVLTYIGALHPEKCWWQPLPPRPEEGEQ